MLLKCEKGRQSFLQMQLKGDTLESEFCRTSSGLHNPVFDLERHKAFIKS